jgi:hypothetical protein
MTIIRTRCSQCGEVDVGPEAILLLVPESGADGSYRFTCPVCRRDVENPAESKIVALLVSAGVQVVKGRGSMQAVAGDDPQAKTTSAEAVPAPGTPLPRDVFLAREALYEEMLGAVGRTMAIAEGKGPGGAGRADPDRENRSSVSWKRGSGSPAVRKSRPNLDRWGVRQFQFFIQHEVQRKFREKGDDTMAIRAWDDAQRARQVLREITTELERRVSDELRQ